MADRKCRPGNDISGLRPKELGRAARRSLANGDFAEAIRAKEAKDTAEKLLGLKDEELAKVLSKAIQRLDEQHTPLWTLVRSFNLVSRKKQIDLVERFVKGFVAMPVSEQAATFHALSPRVRAARRGWSEGSSKSKKKGKSLEVIPEQVIPEQENANRPFPAFVGARGRREADRVIVELLDTLDESLRLIASEDRARLHRRLDRAVSASFTPIVLAKMFAKLPPDEVKCLEKWLVDENALPAPAAQRLFSALTSAQQAGSLVEKAVDGVYLGADALWAQMARISLEFATGPDEIDGNWKKWLQGRAPSPSKSVLGDMVDEDDVVSVYSTSSTRGRAAAPSSSSKSRGSIGPAVLGGGYGVSSAMPSTSGAKRASCQLHCPASLFLFADKGPPGASSLRLSKESLVDFVGSAAKAVEDQNDRNPTNLSSGSAANEEDASGVDEELLDLQDANAVADDSDSPEEEDPFLLQGALDDETAAQ
eukprot:TRINITY_DN83415_c0_g1_i1.p1 TRINITY_DN83415_c0_g1~~TRINITY_DN83415_c0_g1_i1.p1  ORF type:complete len:479 (-),score=110.47 TRINITY_DN83415_c0_g1_i1:130-1566(-)